MSEKHPVQIMIGRNDAMNCFEIMVQAGNFKSRRDAEIYAAAVKDLFEKLAGATFATVQ